MTAIPSPRFTEISETCWRQQNDVHWITNLSTVAVKLGKSYMAVMLLTCTGEMPGSKPRLLTYFLMLVHRIVLEIGHGFFYLLG
jgi:hypothetical protein